MQLEWRGITVECVDGDIVNAANAELRPGGGVAGALHRAAGPGLEEEGRKFAPIKPGQAVVTGGHNLPNQVVIHCLGPVYGVDKPEEKLLAECYRNAIELAEKQQIESIAFPSISTGIFGYPMEEAAAIAFKTVKEMLPSLQWVKLIRFVLHGKEALELHCKMMGKILKSGTVADSNQERY